MVIWADGKRVDFAWTGVESKIDTVYDSSRPYVHSNDW